MKAVFKKKIAHIRYIDGKMNMITFRVPFKDLPIGAKFRFGYQQDDVECEKTEGFYFKSDTGVYPIFKADKIVLIDFFLPQNL